MSVFLSSNQQRAYANDGFVSPIAVMSDLEARQHYQRLIEIEAQHGDMHYRVKPYLISTSANQIATNAALLDAVESIIGPDILLWDSSYVIKEPHSGSFVSWHQDLTYWGLDMSSDNDLVSAWVALTPATQLNGCMQFVVGSHALGTFTHEDTYDDNNILHRGQSIAETFNDNAVAQAELSPGEASLHHGWVVHSSNPNVSNERRVGLVMNYLKPRVRQVIGDVESATLVRGRDDVGHFVDEPVCRSDFAAANVAFQLMMEQKKRDVYDTA